jgi:hypothetical protein
LKGCSRWSRRRDSCSAAGAAWRRSTENVAQAQGSSRTSRRR